MAEHLLPCDICSTNRATVVHLIGEVGLEGLVEPDKRMWTARCALHPSRAQGEDDAVTIGVTTVMRGN